jgi:hypothetical protein
VARQYGYQKIALAQALGLLAEHEPIGYGWLVLELSHHFSCSERAAKDAISILRRGRWVELAQPEVTALRQPRDPQPTMVGRHTYRMTERGHALLEHPNGPRLLRIARKLFTTCPSPKVRRFQQRTEAGEGRDQALRRFENDILAPDGPTPSGLAGVRPWNIRAAIREAIQP